MRVVEGSASTTSMGSVTLNPNNTGGENVMEEARAEMEVMVSEGFMSPAEAAQIEARITEATE
jgi:hypothetical protein